MIDIVAHFFVLYPLFTIIKQRSSSLLQHATSAFVLLAVATFLTQTYLMEVSLVAKPDSLEEQNLYQVFETTPQAFMALNSSDVKKMYRELSRKYHPDKNEEDTTDKFMKLKLAFEILNDNDKRVMYDVYGQEDFSADDRM